MIQRMCVLMLRAGIVFLITSCLGSHALTYDLGLVELKQDVLKGLQSCRDAGYDGLASAATPEAFRYAREFTYTFWKDDGGIYIGLRFLPGDQPRWEDGTLAASDTPWGWEDPPDKVIDPMYGRINRVGKIRLFDGTQKRTALCGRYSKADEKEIRGTSADGYFPSEARSILAKTQASSYLKCVTLCGQTTECRAATFNFDLHTCTAYGPGNNTLLSPNTAVKTFLRNGFIEI